MPAPIAGVERLKRNRTPSGIEIDGALLRADHTGVLGVGLRSRGWADRLVNRDQLCSVRKYTFDLDNVGDSGNPRQHVIGCQDGRTKSDEVGDAAAFASPFEDLIGDQRDGFRIIQFQSSGAPLAGKLRGREDR